MSVSLVRTFSPALRTAQCTRMLASKSGTRNKTNSQALILKALGEVTTELKYLRERVEHLEKKPITHSPVSASVPVVTTASATLTPDQIITIEKERNATQKAIAQTQANTVGTSALITVLGVGSLGALAAAALL